MWKQSSIKIGSLAAAALLVLAGCGGASRSDSAYKEASTEYAAAGAYSNALYDMDAAPTEEWAEAEESGGELSQADQVGETAAQTSRKLITTMRMSAETTAFDELVAWVEQRVAGLGGYIESEDIYNGSSYNGRSRTRSASMTLRIPAQGLAGFVENLTEQSNITSQNRSVEDVTLSYVDMQSKRSALLKEEETLLKFMDQAETIDDLISIESRLTDVRYQLESAESQLRTYDNRINYSTVYLNIDEVQIYTPVEEETVGQRIVNGFRDSCESVADGLTDLFVWLVTHIPQLVVLVVLIVIVVLIWRACGGLRARSAQKRAARKAEKQAQKAAQQAAKAGAAPVSYSFGTPNQAPAPAPDPQVPAQTNEGQKLQ